VITAFSITNNNTTVRQMHPKRRSKDMESAWVEVYMGMCAMFHDDVLKVYSIYYPTANVSIPETSDGIVC
jgi:hypothetical protein